VSDYVSDATNVILDLSGLIENGMAGCMDVFLGSVGQHDPVVCRHINREVALEATLEQFAKPFVIFRMDPLQHRLDTGRPLLRIEAPNSIHFLGPVDRFG